MKRHPLFWILLAAFGLIGYGSVWVSRWFKGRKALELTQADWESVYHCVRSRAPDCAYSEPVNNLLEINLLAWEQAAVAAIVITAAVLIRVVAKTSVVSFIALFAVFLLFGLAAQFIHLYFAEAADHFVRSGLASLEQDCLVKRTSTSCVEHAMRLQGIRYGAMVISHLDAVLLAIAALPVAVTLAGCLGKKRPAFTAG